jgi:hypothetical protein
VTIAASGAGIGPRRLAQGARHALEIGTWRVDLRPFDLEM